MPLSTVPRRRRLELRLVKTSPRIAFMLFVVATSGCALRSYTEAYSDLRDRQAEEGITLPTIADSNQEFLGRHTAALNKLKAIIDSRSTLASLPSQYTLGPGDRIEVNVFDVPEFNTVVTINDAGLAALPIVGPVKLGGLDLDAARTELTKALEKPIKNPQVVLTVTEFGSQRVAVLGAVTKPGSYPLKRGANSLSELLAEAGGPSEKAGNFIQFMPAEETGIVTSNDSSSRASFALSKIISGEPASAGVDIPASLFLGTEGGIPIDAPVRGGDVIVVPEGGKVTVDGEVEKRGAVEIEPGMTVVGALGASGGITYSARVEEVEIIRPAERGQRTRYIVDLEKIMSGEQKDVLLKSGDMIRVPSHQGRRLSSDTFESISRLINFGFGGNVNLAQ
jgi:polysaccharide biosynthesis/export protein